MVFKNIVKTLLTTAVLVALPFSLSANQDRLWNKVSDIAADNWVASNTLDQDELSQLASLANAGDSNAQYALGMFYNSQSKYLKAKSWLKRAAEQGHVPARLGYIKNAAESAEVASLTW